MVSIIINTKNEENNIGRCLRSITDQIYKDYEVIVVDNSSTDETVKIAGSFGAQVGVFGPERSEQKNYGAGLAKGDLLLFVDADMELTPGVVGSCVSIANEGYDAIVIAEESVGTGFWSKCRTLEKRMYFNDPLIEAPRFFKKEVFQKAGGYATGMVSGEDWDLREKIKKNGARMGRINDLIYHHEGNLKLVDSLKKKFYYSARSKKYLSKNPLGISSIVLFIFRPAYIRNIRYLFSDPAHFLGVLFLKTAELILGTVGIIYSKFL